MNVLAIETSCDDTALSLVQCEGDLNPPAGGLSFKVLKNIVSSQVDTHRPYGGVVPHLAKREHIKNLPKVFGKIFEEYGIMNYESWDGNDVANDIDAIAVTVGPGLAPALWAGVNFAKELAEKLGKPLLGANHLEGHMYSILLPQNAVGNVGDGQAKRSNNSNKPSALGHSPMGEPDGDRTPRTGSTEEILASLKFPAVGLIVSGGHTIVLRMDSLQFFEKLGETRDDAAGEAFDKVAKILGFPYPGGPEIEKLAEAWDKRDIGLPRPMMDSDNLDFSFSGLKTAVLYHTRDHKYSDVSVAGNFQQAVIDILLKKTEKAVEQVGASSIFFCGGVAASNAIRQALREKAEELGVSLLLPSEFVYNTDNAAMIAVAAYMAKLRGVEYKIEADPNLNL